MANRGPGVSNIMSRQVNPPNAFILYTVITHAGFSPNFGHNKRHLPKTVSRISADRAVSFNLHSNTPESDCRGLRIVNTDSLLATGSLPPLWAMLGCPSLYVTVYLSPLLLDRIPSILNHCRSSSGLIKPAISQISSTSVAVAFVSTLSSAARKNTERSSKLQKLRSCSYLLQVIIPIIQSHHMRRCQ